MMAERMWTICKKNHKPEDLISRFPNPVCHDGVNVVFVDAPEDTDLAFMVPEDLELDQLIITVGGYLATQTDTPLIATKQQLVLLFNTPHHRLWCAKYTDKDALEVDYKAAFGVDSIDKRKSLDDLNAKARADILSYIKSVA